MNQLPAIVIPRLDRSIQLLTVIIRNCHSGLDPESNRSIINFLPLLFSSEKSNKNDTSSRTIPVTPGAGSRRRGGVPESLLLLFSDEKSKEEYDI